MGNPMVLVKSLYMIQNPPPFMDNPPLMALLEKNRKKRHEKNLR